MTYTELINMPIDEFFSIVECANEISEQRSKEMK